MKGPMFFHHTVNDVGRKSDRLSLFLNTEHEWKLCINNSCEEVIFFTLEAIL